MQGEIATIMRCFSVGSSSIVSDCILKDVGVAVGSLTGFNCGSDCVLKGCNAYNLVSHDASNLEEANAFNLYNVSNVVLHNCGAYNCVNSDNLKGFAVASSHNIFLENCLSMGHRGLTGYGKISGFTLGSNTQNITLQNCEAHYIGGTEFNNGFEILSSTAENNLINCRGSNIEGTVILLESGCISPLIEGCYCRDSNVGLDNQSTNNDIINCLAANNTINYQGIVPNIVLPGSPFVVGGNTSL